MQRRDNERFWHSDVWWTRLSEGRITAAEAVAWQAHLQQCTSCREEWQAWQAMEHLLTTAPFPTPSPTFVENTLARWHSRRRRRWLIAIALLVIIPLATFGYSLLIGNTLLHILEVTRWLSSTLALLISMLVRSIVTIGLAMGNPWPWILTTFVIALMLLTFLDSTLFASGVVVLQRRRRR